MSLVNSSLTWKCEKKHCPFGVRSEAQENQSIPSQTFFSWMNLKCAPYARVFLETFFCTLCIQSARWEILFPTQSELNPGYFSHQDFHIFTLELEVCFQLSEIVSTFYRHLAHTSSPVKHELTFTPKLSQKKVTFDSCRIYCTLIWKRL